MNNLNNLTNLTNLTHTPVLAQQFHQQGGQQGGQAPETAAKTARKTRLAWALRGALALAGLSALGAAGIGCGLISADILDITFKLSTVSYAPDFGNSTGTVPIVQCTNMPTACSQAADQVKTQVQNATATGRCDMAVQPAQCVVDLGVALTYPITLANDQSFATSVGGKLVSAVRSIQLDYAIPSNTTNLALPEMQLYIGPQNAKSPTDKDVVFIDKIPPLAKGMTLPAGQRSIKIADGTQARERFVYYVQNPTTPFVLLLTAAPTVKGGEPVPAGKLDLKITPVFTVGLPR